MTIKDMIKHKKLKPGDIVRITWKMTDVICKVIGVSAGLTTKDIYVISGKKCPTDYGTRGFYNHSVNYECKKIDKKNYPEYTL